MLFRRLGLALALSLLVTLPAFCVDEGDFACVGAKVYPSPTDPPIENAALLVHDGKIVAVGPSYRLKNKFPHSAVTIDCKGKVVVAGFWNSHVHFETGWQDAANVPPPTLTAHMTEMLTRWGFTTVWDLGSEPNNTLALRQRVKAKFQDPDGRSPKGGHPVYLPPEMQLPEAATLRRRPAWRSTSTNGLTELPSPAPTYQSRR